MLLETVTAQPEKGIFEGLRTGNETQTEKTHTSDSIRGTSVLDHVVYGVQGKPPSNAPPTQCPHSANWSFFSLKAEMTIKIHMVWRRVMPSIVTILLYYFVTEDPKT